ncbi:hypothetical protein BKA67DRAFT_565260 [Truncatella angustata]|uniref:Uncharacterized protein n=1 Tax=Truncatella angustata TaxID=152316 RepID=A0A9P8ZX62_9PEZI|nr:uncharacterized protein BKA67DRAFT_565260 [Truncatella angustata]KAH6654482.1 hypothetical protein BKA67DRAFT_565260 [Truncatella angustata]
MEKKKFVFQLDTPYTAVSWPQITLEDQDTILELLCTLLTPIGHHRAEYVKPSKGKKERKRKHKETEDGEPQPASPPAPELASFVDVGLSVVTRNLQDKAASAGGNGPEVRPEPNTSKETKSSPPSYSAIFVARSGQPNTINNHLPQMVAVASSKTPAEQTVRLVGFSKSCQDRLSEALGIPRVSVVGLREDAPASKALVEFIRQHVSTIEIAWLKEAREADFKETKIDTIETFIGERKKGKRGDGVGNTPCSQSGIRPT